jgi:hypothetical protein
MIRQAAEEAASLVAIVLFCGMIAVWAAVLA